MAMDTWATIKCFARIIKFRKTENSFDADEEEFSLKTIKQNASKDIMDDLEEETGEEIGEEITEETGEETGKEIENFEDNPIHEGDTGTFDDTEA